MKYEYMNPELEIVTFVMADIITTSSDPLREQSELNGTEDYSNIFK